MGISRCLKNQDLFGHAVLLNFDRKGDTINTVIGGVLSLFSKFVLLAFLLAKGSDLVNKKDPAIS